MLSAVKMFIQIKLQVSLRRFLQISSIQNFNIQQDIFLISTERRYFVCLLML